MEKLVNESLDDFEKKGVTDDDILKFKNGFESRTNQSVWQVCPAKRPSWPRFKLLPATQI